ncbi:MAG TPA: hypothetical protein VN372_05405 [Methanospirillum sp.]|nr:hypothetical protein [Methanospirillum sp.]
MGEKIVAYFEKAKAIGGFKGQMRMAVITKISLQKAASDPDTPEGLKLVEDAYREIEKEFVKVG